MPIKPPRTLGTLNEKTIPNDSKRRDIKSKHLFFLLKKIKFDKLGKPTWVWGKIRLLLKTA